jgi:hypothetical protein
MIAVAGPLVVASKGLTSALYSKDQMIATFLAQESMETIKNIRDNNISSDPQRGWLTGYDRCFLNDSAPCDASAFDQTVILTGCNNVSSKGCPLYVNSSGYTRNPSGATPTIFYRSFYFTGVNPAGCIATNCTEVRVNVVLNWNEGTIPYQVELTSQMTNVAR